MVYYIVQSSKIPQILLDFTSAQSFIAQEWEPYGSEENSVRLKLEYNTRLGKRVLVKEGYGTDAAVRYKTSSHPPLDWRFLHYELVVQLHPESIICINVLDSTGKNRTILYSSAILPTALNQWEEFHVPLNKSISDRNWHSLLIDLPVHMEQAGWPSFVRLNWFSIRGEVVIAGIRGCDNKDRLRKSATISPYSIGLTSAKTPTQPLSHSLFSNKLDLENIHKLLNEGFSEQELRNFCFFEATFRSIHEQLRDEDRKTKILYLILDHARRKNLLGKLLAWAEEKNPAKYSQHQPYIIDDTTLLFDE